MAIGRISGPMLYSSLDRQGVSLAIDANLTYFDVTNRRVGINTTNPIYSFDSVGNAKIANIIIAGSNITSNTGKINFGDWSNLTITGGAANYIVITDGSGNLSFIEANTLPSILGITANITSANIHINILEANVGAYEIYANANLGTATTNITSLQGNIFAANLHIQTLDANIGTLVNTTLPNTFTSINTAITHLQTNVSTSSGVITTGNINAGNIILSGKAYTDFITPNLTNVTVFNSNTAIKLPIGTSAQRPPGSSGYVRYNTDTPALEYYDGTAWVAVTNTVTDQQIIPNGTSNTFTLDQTSSSIGAIVSINGTLQQPNTAYTITGNQITFAETPLPTDSIDIRFLGASVTINTTLSDDLLIAGNLTVNGTITPGNWTPGQTIKTTILYPSDMGISTDVTTTGTGGNIATYSYTPISSSSYLMVEFGGRYQISGTSIDSWWSNLYVDSTQIGVGHMNWSTSGDQTARTGLLFPLLGRYTNTSNSMKTVYIQANRDSSDDNFTMYYNSNFGFWMRIIELAR